MDEVRSVMLLEDAPASDESLTYCRSMRDRRRQKLPTQLPKPALSKLKEWASDTTSSLLLAQGHGVRTSCLDFATDFLDAVLQQGHPILWALPLSVEDTTLQPSITGILRSLISQALSLNPAAMDEGVNPITIKHIKSAMTIDQWFAIFERCISCFPHLFLVIDIGLVEVATAHEESEQMPCTVGDFVEHISEIVKRRGNRGSLKVIIVCWRFSALTSLDISEVFDEMHIKTDMGKRVERLIRQPKYRWMFRQKNREFAENFRSAVSMVPLHNGASDTSV